MDLMDEDLSAYFRERVPAPGLSLAQKLSLVHQVLKGTLFLHDNNIVHRDIKPANVLIKLRPNDLPVLKLADYGLSKLLDPDQTSDMSSHQGTADYMAPEFWKLDTHGRISYKKSVDIFAAGIALHVVMQHRGGQLTLSPDGTRNPDELRHPIGELMHIRDANNQPSLQVVASTPDDCALTRATKQLIKECNAFTAATRPTAALMESRLSQLVTTRDLSLCPQLESQLVKLVVAGTRELPIGRLHDYVYLDDTTWMLADLLDADVGLQTHLCAVSDNWDEVHWSCRVGGLLQEGRLQPMLNGTTLVCTHVRGLMIVHIQSRSKHLVPIDMQPNFDVTDNYIYLLQLQTIFIKELQWVDGSPQLTDVSSFPSTMNMPLRVAVATEGDVDLVLARHEAQHCLHALTESGAIVWRVQLQHQAVTVRVEVSMPTNSEACYIRSMQKAEESISMVTRSLGRRVVVGVLGRRDQACALFSSGFTRA